jgi:hypothetical protein
MLTLLLGILGTAASLAYDAPKEWTSVAAGSSMRLAEWRVGEQSEVVIFYFGPGQGGSPEANVDRWIGQFEQPDGSSTRDRAKRSESTAGDLKVTRVDITGTYVAAVRPGATERRNEPDTRMIAIVIEGPGGPWFIRFLGPREEVSAREAAFDRFLSSLRLE